MHARPVSLSCVAHSLFNIARPSVRRAAVFLTLAISAAPITAIAQSYPTKPIKIISPFGAGSPPDATARLVAQELSRRFGQNVVVENRPGAGGTIATKAAAGEAPDGYTLLQVNAALAYAPALYANPGYDPLRNFVPVASLANWSLALVVSKDVPANSIQEFIAYAKANPGKVNIAFPYGSPPQILAERFKLTTGAPLNSVPYHQLSQLSADLMAGRIQAIFSIAPGLVAAVREGKLKALVYAGTARHPALKDVPTVAEAGLPDLTLEPSDWVGIVAPAGTRPEIVQTLNTAINDILKSDEVRATFSKLGWRVTATTPEEFGAFLSSELVKWPRLAKAAGFKPN
jgi:tripartite-type tricarboxylate transporter receptor subunit TctC